MQGSNLQFVLGVKAIVCFYWKKKKPNQTKWTKQYNDIPKPGNSQCILLEINESH